MIEAATVLVGRDPVVAAADHPYVRLGTGDADDITGHLLDGTLVWTQTTPSGPVGAGHGDPVLAVRLLTELLGSGRLAGARWLHLPGLGPRAVVPGLTVTRRDDWQFRWTTTAPPARPDEDRVVPLGADDEAEIAALMAAAFPASTTRPGDPRIRRWWGIRARGRLVACGADRSRGGIGFLAGLTVAPDLRGRGLGAALAATLTRELLAGHGTAALGVMSDNAAAIGLYERLGFTDSLERTSVARRAGPVAG